jgi:hypothetical protein
MDWLRSSARNQILPNAAGRAQTIYSWQALVCSRRIPRSFPHPVDLCPQTTGSHIQFVHASAALKPTGPYGTCVWSASRKWQNFREPILRNITVAPPSKSTRVGFERSKMLPTMRYANLRVLEMLISRYEYKSGGASRSRLRVIRNVDLSSRHPPAERSLKDQPYAALSVMQMDETRNGDNFLLAYTLSRSVERESVAYDQLLSKKDRLAFSFPSPKDVIRIQATI